MCPALVKKMIKRQRGKLTFPEKNECNFLQTTFEYSLTRSPKEITAPRWVFYMVVLVLKLCFTQFKIQAHLFVADNL